MKVRALKNFYDKKENKDRKVGEEFIVNKQRFAEIQKAYSFPLVKEVKEEPEK